jgi:hypothetical protein
LKSPIFELDRDEPTHTSVEEQQVDVEVVIVDHDALLPLDEREPATDLQQRALDLAQSR